ncbi:hypothetical protein Bpfe_023313 [Biomphalaria pfeifferi]|uniref:Uncharacterized protein n=1 Tax=Biomphalaria pfeifferi TaxID=112525 RepID=A0AAD8B473_BIOPF|nr:hypothetical protein Bpfe_023313 [Biomphalaria pfeifferi]
MTYTRSDRDIFLIGLSEFEPLSNLNQLPTTRQFLQRFHHHLKDTKLVRDASHLTVEETRIEEDRAFLADQRGCRKMFMTGEDKEMAAQQERVHDKQQKQLLRKENEEKRQQRTMEGESGENETESCESSNQFEVLDEYELYTE